MSYNSELPQFFTVVESCHCDYLNGIHLEGLMAKTIRADRQCVTTEVDPCKTLWRLACQSADWRYTTYQQRPHNVPAVLLYQSQHYNYYLVYSLRPTEYNNEVKRVLLNSLFYIGVPSYFNQILFCGQCIYFYIYYIYISYI